MVVGELTTSHATDGMNEVATVKVLEPVLVRVVGVGMTVKVVSGGVFPTFLVTCIL